MSLFRTAPLMFISTEREIPPSRPAKRRADGQPDEPEGTPPDPPWIPWILLHLLVVPFVVEV